MIKSCTFMPLSNPLLSSDKALMIWKDKNTQNHLACAVFTSLSFGWLLYLRACSLTICVCFTVALLIHIHFKAHFESLVESWGMESIFLTLICLPIHFECTDLFCLPLSVLIIHSFIWFDFLFIRFIWVIAQPTIWWTAMDPVTKGNIMEPLSILHCVLSYS